LPNGIRDQVSTALPVKTRNDINQKVIKPNGYCLTVAANIRGLV
jgi:hypothetical protein